MARYRTIQISFWNDPYIEQLSPEGKLLYLYLFTSPHTNNLGVLEITRRKISNETGISEKLVNKIISDLENDGKVIVDGYKMLLSKFIKNQTSISTKIITGLTSLFKELESVKLKDALCILYPDLFAGIYTPSKGIDTPCIPIDTVCIDHPEYEVELEDELELEVEKEVELEGEYELEEKAECKTDKHYARSTISCPHQKIIELYHRVLPELPAVVEWTEARKKMLAQRWREKKERQNLEWWERYFYRVKASDFLTGKVENRKGSSPFLADLEWLIRPSNLPKVIEGRYDNRKGKDIYQQASEMGLDECIKGFYDGFEIPVQKPQAVMKHD